MAASAVIVGLGAYKGLEMLKDSMRPPMPPVINFPGGRDAEDAESADKAGQRQRKRAAGAGGRASTILTSPLGLPADAVTGTAQAKTLLGL